VNAAYRALKEKADALEQKQNEFTTEAAQMAVKLERQVKKNADQEDMIATLKRQGDPDLIAQIDKLKDEIRTTYERGQAFREEAAQARRRAELAEEKAKNDRKKLDEAAMDNYRLLGQLEDMQDKLGSEANQPTAPVVPFSGNPYTINTLLRDMADFVSVLEKFGDTKISSTKNSVADFDEYLRDIVTKLGAIKKQIQEVA
jgi:outer membrane murein-binding lipoprotein Lpp